MLKEALRGLSGGGDQVEKTGVVPNEAIEDIWKAKVFGTCQVPFALVGGWGLGVTRGETEGGVGDDL